MHPSISEGWDIKLTCLDFLTDINKTNLMQPLLECDKIKYSVLMQVFASFVNQMYTGFLDSKSDVTFRF